MLWLKQRGRWKLWPTLLLLLLLLLSSSSACVFCSHCSSQDKLCYVLRSAFTGNQISLGCASQLDDLNPLLSAPPPPQWQRLERWCGIAVNHTILCLCSQPLPLPTPLTPPTPLSASTSSPSPSPSMRTHYIHPWYLQDQQRVSPASLPPSPDLDALYPLQASSRRVILLSFTTLSPHAAAARARRFSALRSNSSSLSLPASTSPSPSSLVPEDRKIENYQSAINDKQERNRLTKSAPPLQPLFRVLLLSVLCCL